MLNTFFEFFEGSRRAEEYADHLHDTYKKRRGIPVKKRHQNRNASLNLSGAPQPNVSSTVYERLNHNTPFFDSLVDKNGFLQTNTKVRDALTSPKGNRGSSPNNASVEITP